MATTLSHYLCYYRKKIQKKKLSSKVFNKVKDFANKLDFLWAGSSMLKKSKRKKKKKEVMEVMRKRRKKRNLKLPHTNFKLSA